MVLFLQIFSNFFLVFLFPFSGLRNPWNTKKKTKTETCFKEIKQKTFHSIKKLLNSICEECEEKFINNYVGKYEWLVFICCFTKYKFLFSCPKQLQRDSYALTVLSEQFLNFTASGLQSFQITDRRLSVLSLNYRSPRSYG